MIDQISIYTENKRGSARAVFNLLAEKNINVLCFMNSDSGEFGTMRLIVSDTDTAMAELNEKGYMCKRDKVIAAVLDDEPGALEKFLMLFEDMNINIEYMYALCTKTDEAAIVIKPSDIEKAQTVLKDNGYTLFTDGDLF